MHKAWYDAPPSISSYNGGIVLLPAALQMLLDMIEANLLDIEVVLMDVQCHFIAPFINRHACPSLSIVLGFEKNFFFRCECHRLRCQHSFL